MFHDLVLANEWYASQFSLGDLEPTASRGLAVVTCIDSRIEPLAMLGLVPGDAKILRNGGGRVTDDVLRTLVLAVHLLGVERVMVMHHTECAMAERDDEALRQAVEAASGQSAAGWDFHAIGDQDGDLADDVDRIRQCPLIPNSVMLGGFRYDVRTGRIHPVVDG